MHTHTHTHMHSSCSKYFIIDTKVSLYHHNFLFLGTNASFVISLSLSLISSLTHFVALCFSLSVFFFPLSFSLRSVSFLLSVCLSLSLLQFRSFSLFFFLLFYDPPSLFASIFPTPTSLLCLFLALPLYASFLFTLFSASFFSSLCLLFSFPPLYLPLLFCFPLSNHFSPFLFPLSPTLYSFPPPPLPLPLHKVTGHIDSNRFL